MKIAIVAAELGPYAKAGGLADVIGALPPALAALGAAPSLIVPGYASLLERFSNATPVTESSLTFGTGRERFRILRGSYRDLPLYLIDHPGFFHRDGIYHDASGEYSDNFQRFVFFGRAALVAAEAVQPDLIHCHDWHAATTAIVMRADPALRAKFAATRSFFTIHNLAFQGLFDAGDFPLLGLDQSWLSGDGLEFYGRGNLMKGAVILADGVSTVSPSYAYEAAHDPTIGFGLEHALRARGADFVGILNGADYDEWDPARDELLPARYAPDDPHGKVRCREVLREMVSLPPAREVPIIGMVTRLTTQKGLDLLGDAIDQVMALGVQLVMLAEGDRDLARIFAEAEQRYPDRLRVRPEFDHLLAHRIQGGSDIFLMPSRFEPCGLTQMYALKYGTVPVVRATGGLRDTVREFNPANGQGNGFVFEEYTPAALVAALRRAVTSFQQPTVWRQIMANAFAADFSWTVAAGKYLACFERLRRNAKGSQP